MNNYPSIYVVPTDDQERRLNALMVDHESAKVTTYRLGYAKTSVMEIEFEDGTMVRLNDDGEVM